MSVKAARRISMKSESKKCAARFWRFVPHLLLCSSLVAYAALGALIFQYIEGQKPSAIQQEYDNFLRQVVKTVQRPSDNDTSTEHLVEGVKKMMQDEFKSIYFQRHDRWDFFGSMFFCCTVFTTVGFVNTYLSTWRRYVDI